MPLLLAVTLAAAVQPTCSWDNPGHNPYTGGVIAAIDRYTDIPEAVRSTLKRRMAEGQADDQVDISRDAIAGKNKYDAAIRDMHFGKASVCQTVTRSKWSTDRVEPAAVYCVEQHCILVPRICGNVSRITKTGEALANHAASDEQADDRQLAHAGGQVPELEDMGLLDATPTEETPEEKLERAMRAARTRGLLSSIVEPEEAALDEGDANRLGAWGRHGFDGAEPAESAAPVPEADTWAMLLAGLGLIGWQARRRARRQNRGQAPARG